jgi:membrane-associated protease RseP (regulator of RpoE activity)
MVEKTEKTSIEIPTNWAKFLDKHGWPTVLVFLGGMGIWNFTTWLRPRVDKLLDNHFETVRQLTETQAAQVENGKKLVNIAESEVKKTDDISQKVIDVHRVIVGGKIQKGD